MSRTIRPGLALGLCSLALACAVAEDDRRPVLPSNGGGPAGSEAGSTTVDVPAAGTTGSPLGGTANGGSPGGGAPSTAGTGTSGTGAGSGGTATGGSGSGSGGSSGGAAGTGGSGSGGAGKAGSGGTSSGGSAGTTASGGQGGTGVVVPTVCPAPVGPQAALPLVVTANFIPSGYFAGPAVNTAGIVAAACDNRPPAHTVGACSKFTFQASMLEGNGAYGGVFWQFGANNWGTGPGKSVAAGATKVTFKAWSAGAGGEQVEFSAGGLGDAASLCKDTVNLGIGGGNMVTLTTTPTQYTVDLKGQTYATGIIGGFVWSTAVTSVAQVVSFYVDEIQWVP